MGGESEGKGRARSAFEVVHAARSTVRFIVVCFSYDSKHRTMTHATCSHHECEVSLSIFLSLFLISRAFSRFLFFMSATHGRHGDFHMQIYFAMYFSLCE